MKLYKNKYLIGVYGPLSEGETLLGLCSNLSEFAKLMHIKKSNASEILRLAFNKKTQFIRFFGKLCTVEFILNEELENDL